MAILTNLGDLVQEAVDGSYTDAQVKSKYENNANTNAYTDAEKTIVANVTSNLAGKVDDSQVLTNVPADAVFTDTTYTNVSEFVNDSGYLTLATETTTSISLSANILTYTDEDGVDTNIDISLYLDDTNLARLTSATLDGNGIATFTRDDATTFTLDLSNLLDNQIASEVPFTPVGNVASTDVQSAIAEVDNKLTTITEIV